MSLLFVPNFRNNTNKVYNLFIYLFIYLFIFLKKKKKKKKKEN